MDALDEVSSGNLEMALKCLKIIQNEFCSVRLWIASSKTFPGEEAEFKLTFCNVMLFSFEDKIEFLKQAYKEKNVGIAEKKV